jgi:hypothetical protein
MLQAASLFNQLLQHFPRTEFGSLVKKHQAERAAKGFTCWTQFVSMTFCQLAHADSLREICNGLACSEGKLVHLGITNAPNKSTLSYANEHRPAALFEDLFYTSLNRFRSQEGMGARKAKFRFQNKLLSLDSTTISLCLDLFPWAKFRRAKGGVKAHVLLDHDDYLPSYVLITEAKKSDVRIAQSLELNVGSIVAIDRGYCDYALFGKWDGRGVFFVTRLKDNAAYEVVESAIGPLPRNILADELIRFTGAKAVKNYPHPVRRVVVWDPINEREIVLLTNLLHFGSTTIAAIYKDRWEIELFFKALKTEFEGEEFCGHQPECAADSDLDRADRHAAVEMDAPSLPGEVVLLQSGLHAAFESVHLPGSPPLVGEPLRHAPACPTDRTAQPGSELIGTGSWPDRRQRGRTPIDTLPATQCLRRNALLTRTVGLLDRRR